MEKQSKPTPAQPWRAGILTVSDKAAAGLREDLSGPAIAAVLRAAGYEISRQLIVADEKTAIEQVLISLADQDELDLVLTTGGTGFSPRDITPEATRAVIERETPGIAEAIRAMSSAITSRAMLSRAVSGIRGLTLIINLPGSPKAVREALEFILDPVDHGLQILTGRDAECAR